jgi:hypothetical protein
MKLPAPKGSKSDANELARVRTALGLSAQAQAASRSRAIRNDKRNVSKQGAFGTASLLVVHPKKSLENAEKGKTGEL